MAAIQPHLGVRLFLRVSYECAKKRREGREGYATIEGWWTDPPGYVDKIVWPAYVGEHSWMFKDGNVEGSFDESALEREGVRAQVERGQDVPLEVSLEWAVEEIIRGLEEAARAEGREG
jgi:nicotinamide/nicotinate riboside kinase